MPPPSGTERAWCGESHRARQDRRSPRPHGCTQRRIGRRLDGAVRNAGDAQECDRVCALRAGTSSVQVRVAHERPQQRRFGRAAPVQGDGDERGPFAVPQVIHNGLATARALPVRPLLPTGRATGDAAAGAAQLAVAQEVGHAAGAPVDVLVLSARVRPRGWPSRRCTRRPCSS